MGRKVAIRKPGDSPMRFDIEQEAGGRRRESLIVIWTAPVQPEIDV